MESCYLDFSITDSDSLSRLVEFVAAIELERDTPWIMAFPKWYAFLRPEERATFWWPNRSQLGEARQLWGDVPIDLVEKTPNEQDDWDLYSFFALLKHSDLRFTGIVEASPGVGRLNFTVHEDECSGGEALERLVQTFGHLPIAADFGFGLESFEADGLSD